MARERQSLLEFFDLEAPYITEFKRLLYQLSNNKSEKELKSILFTSAMLSEGKSTVCAFLSVLAAEKKNIRVLLVDSDIRRPTIKKLFDLKNTPGLHDILIGECKPSDAIIKTSIRNLDILTAGTYCPNPAEVFDAEEIASMIEEFKFFYDLIIIDAPPLLPVSDPMLLSSKVDGVVLVVKAGVTQKDVVRRAVEILNPDEINVIGVVMNNMTHSLPYHYDYNYYNYEYKTKPGFKKNNPKKLAQKKTLNKSANQKKNHNLAEKEK